jgi:hypothetical protein
VHCQLRRLTPEPEFPQQNAEERQMPLLASDFDKSRFFKADDLEGERKLRIKSVTTEAIGVGAEKDEKLVVWFTNDKRGLVLNRVNNRTLRGAFGDDTAGWASKVVIIFPMMVEMRGKMVPGIRVRIPPPKQSGQAAVAAKLKGPGNGQTAVRAKQTPPIDEELEDEPPAQPPAKATGADEFNDEIDF